ncbi:Peroxisome membrane protein [Macleaya cordata]|uniref:Peroxisomal membrane protein PEX16 n=1 Tax=Macleaya cordata TaxID=56857 RepID=A0A200QPH7_MACCD|nr:Peroxisome membrane protein [Macleaya cordata]
MEAYRKWGLTWLLPERFSASEIGPEAVTAVLGIFTAINEHIIESDPTRSQMGSTESSSFPWSLGISMLKDLETLVEVMAQQFYGDDKKWNFIALTEATKVLLRLALFRDGGYKMLLSGGEIANVEKGPEPSNSEHRMGNFVKPGGDPGPGSLRDHYGRDQQNLEGRALSALSKFAEDARIISEPKWLNKFQNRHSLTAESPTPVARRPTLSTIWSEKGLHGVLFLTAEVLHISRPLIYVLFVRKYGVRSWVPWLLSLSMDLTGMSILSHVTHHGHSRGGRSLTLSASEKDEIKRRKMLLAFYLMRDPFFSQYTRQRLETIEKVSEPVPIIGFLTAKLIELIIGAQTRYTYMSGS